MLQLYGVGARYYTMLNPCGFQNGSWPDGYVCTHTHTLYGQMFLHVAGNLYVEFVCKMCIQLFHFYCME